MLDPERRWMHSQIHARETKNNLEKASLVGQIYPDELLLFFHSLYLWAKKTKFGKGMLEQVG